MPLRRPRPHACSNQEPAKLKSVVKEILPVLAKTVQKDSQPLATTSGYNRSPVSASTSRLKAANTRQSSSMDYFISSHTPYKENNPASLDLSSPINMQQTCLIASLGSAKTTTGLAIERPKRSRKPKSFGDQFLVKNSVTSRLAVFSKQK